MAMFFYYILYSKNFSLIRDINLAQAHV